MKIVPYGDNIYVIIGLAISATGIATLLVARYIRNKRAAKPQALNIKVTRVQKQDKKEKQKKEKEKEKLLDHLFNEQLYLQHLKSTQLLENCEDKKQRAARILFLELESIVQNPTNNIGLLPRENNLFEWHANIVSNSGVATKGIFHFVITVTDQYPDVGPVATCNCLNYLNVASTGFVWTNEKKLMDYCLALQTFIQNTASASQAEQSLHYTNQKIYHNKDHPWPPVPKVKSILGFAKVETYEETVKKQLICTYTKLNFESTQLGLGVSFTKNIRTGEIQNIHCSTKLLSIKAFNRYKIRTIGAFTFTHWLPIYINEKHAPLNLVERSLSLICKGIATAFEPNMALFVLPKLMNTIIVDTFNGIVPAKEGLKLYCFIHRLFLAMAKKYPEIVESATEQLRTFIRSDEHRHKDVVPNLGDLMSLLCITDIKWSDIKEPLLKEAAARNVYWILRAYPELDPEYKEKRMKDLEERKLAGEDVSAEEEKEIEDVTDEMRIEMSFNATKTGKHITVFQVFFLNNIAQPEGFTKEQISKQYDDFYGLPVENLEKVFLQELQFIKTMNNDDFLAAVGVPPMSDSEQERKLLADIEVSKRKGYHGHTNIKVMKPKEFAMQNKFDISKYMILNDKQEQVLHSDEAKWQKAVQNEWGFETLPPHFNSWREAFLCNQLRDTAESLNESQDFDSLYELANNCKDYVTYLELELFEPTNLKSKYFFLAKILGKLTQLKTFKLMRGEIPLDARAFAALCMGLNKNKQISTLDLENCGINSNTLNSLLSKDLVGDSITKLILSGNSIENTGINILANYLAQHNSLPHLTELHLNGCKISDVSTLADALVFKTKLKVLELKNNNISHTASVLLEKLAYSPSIESISLANNPSTITADALAKILSITGTLKKLNLWKAYHVSLYSDKVYHAFAMNQTLVELDMGRVSNITNFASLGTVLAQNKTLKALTLQSANATAQLLQDLHKSVTLNGGVISLEKLDLSQNRLYTSSAIEEGRKYTENEMKCFEVIGDLISCSPNLKELNLESCNLHQYSIKTIGEALTTNTALVALNLQKNKIGKCVQYLVNPLIKNTTLKELNISGCNLGSAGAIYVAEFLKQNTSLSKLNLYGNFIEPDGCVDVVKAIQSNLRTGLVDLDLGVNRIKGRGLKSIIDWISDENRRFPLTHLYLKQDHMKDIVALNLVNAICDNRARNNLQFLAIYGNGLRNTTINQVASQLQSVGVKFDLEKQLEVKQAERQARTVYLPNIAFSITAEQLKRHFYKNQCGKIVNIEIHSHKVRKNAGASMYAFIEFAEEDSVAMAMSLPVKKRNKIGNCIFKIFRAGITQ